MKASIYFCAIILICGCNRKISASASPTITADSVSSFIAVSAASPATPACILEKIESIKQDHIWNPPAEIHEYENEGKKWYAISADCCDRFTTVVDADCKYFCAPSGGFTGRGDGKCPDFFKQAKHIRLVWKDKRVKNQN